MIIGQANWSISISRTCKWLEISNGKTPYRPLTLIYWKDFNNVWIWQRRFWYQVYVIWKECREKEWHWQRNPYTSKLFMIERLAVSCIFIAQKFYSDFHYEVEDFSICSGIKIKDILKLEMITLELLEYNLVLSERDYFDVLLSNKMWTLSFTIHTQHFFLIWNKLSHQFIPHIFSSFTKLNIKNL